MRVAGLRRVAARLRRRPTSEEGGRDPGGPGPGEGAGEAAGDGSIGAELVLSSGTRSGEQER